MQRVSILLSSPEKLKGKRLVALVAVNNEQHMATHFLLLNLLDRELHRSQTNLIRSPVVFAEPNAPLGLPIGYQGALWLFALKIM